jgi:hypothetical protein
MTPLNLDANLEQADWIKGGAWDIPAQNADELLQYLVARGLTWDGFKALPVYRANVDRIPWLKAMG